MPNRVGFLPRLAGSPGGGSAKERMDGPTFNAFAIEMSKLYDLRRRFCEPHPVLARTARPQAGRQSGRRATAAIALRRSSAKSLEYNPVFQTPIHPQGISAEIIRLGILPTGICVSSLPVAASITDTLSEPAFET